MKLHLVNIEDDLQEALEPSASARRSDLTAVLVMVSTIVGMMLLLTGVALGAERAVGWLARIAPPLIAHSQTLPQ